MISIFSSDDSRVCTPASFDDLDAAFDVNVAALRSERCLDPFERDVTKAHLALERCTQAAARTGDACLIELRSHDRGAARNSLIEPRKAAAQTLQRFAKRVAAVCNVRIR